MICKKFLQAGFIAKLTILSEEAFIQQAQEFVLFYARYFNFSKGELHKIELMTEEAIANTIQNTFGDEDTGMIDVSHIYINPKSMKWWRGSHSAQKAWPPKRSTMINS